MANYVFVYSMLLNRILLASCKEKRSAASEAGKSKLTSPASGKDLWPSQNLEEDTAW